MGSQFLRCYLIDLLLYTELFLPYFSPHLTLFVLKGRKLNRANISLYTVPPPVKGTITFCAIVLTLFTVRYMNNKSMLINFYHQRLMNSTEMTLLTDSGTL